MRPMRASVFALASVAVSGFSTHAGRRAFGGVRRLVAVASERRAEDAEVMMSDDPLVQRVAAEVAEITGGATLDALLNPAKLINLERNLVSLRERLENEGDDAEAEILAELEKKEAQAYVEKRAVMKDWLKSLFRGQAYVTIALSLVMVYDAVPGQHLDLSIQVLGFWSWWLFTVPSLRSIKPLPRPEKKSLDAAFLATLVASLVAPFATKDPAAIWWIDAATVGACYAYGYLVPDGDAAEEDEEDAFDAKAGGGAGAFGQSLWRATKFAFKALDVGSGIERGARSEEKTRLEAALESAIETKAKETRVPPREKKAPAASPEAAVQDAKQTTEVDAKKENS